MKVGESAPWTHERRRHCVLTGITLYTVHTVVKQSSQTSIGHGVDATNLMHIQSVLCRSRPLLVRKFTE